MKYNHDPGGQLKPGHLCAALEFLFSVSGGLNGGLAWGNFCGPDGLGRVKNKWALCLLKRHQLKRRKEREIPGQISMCSKFQFSLDCEDVRPGIAA